MQRRTVDLLPEIFRTETNSKFLAATLDQLTQDPVVKKTYGFVGRRVGPGVNPSDNYVTEPTETRTDYQLEPGVVMFEPDTTRVIDAITYPGMIDALSMHGANVDKQDRLFESEYYAWDPFCDFDKLVNYSQYYWVPGGPDSVDVGATTVPSTDAWTVSRIDTPETKAYQFSDVEGNNPILYMVRGGTYTFDVSQPGYEFWIQAYPGVDGRVPVTPNISSRNVLGVDNNGIAGGTVTFDVPFKTAQDFYYDLTVFGTVDLVTTLEFDQINNIYLDAFFEQNPTGIDGITSLDGRTVVFNNQTNNGWEITSVFDPLPNVGNVVSGTGSYDSTLFDQVIPITLLEDRYSVWKIQYLYDGDGRGYMKLTSVLLIPTLNKFTINFGTQWSSTQWYKDAQGYFEEIPLLTAVLDTLYYQDNTNPDLFGQIRLIDQDEVRTLDVNDIIGAKNYTSPNGVVFTNGLKVQLRGVVVPEQYQNLEFYVEGVGTGPGVEERVGFIDGRAYFGPWHYYQGQKMTGAVHSEVVFQQYIYDNIGESIINTGSGGPDGAPLPTEPIAGVAQGTGIQLLLTSNFVTPETYTKSATIPYDSTVFDAEPYDASLNSPVIPDYITINRAALDLNAWSRSNRWFHIDVINATAQYNNSTAVLNNDYRAKRPIIEFRAGLELYNFGTQGKQPVDIIDFTETDALSNINGAARYNVDGYQFLTGTRVIFAADLDPQVRDRVYEVVFIDPSNTGTKIIDLVPVVNPMAEIDQTVVCLNGLTLQGKSFWFDGVEWISAQEKTSVNQAPLFDVRDINGVSYSDNVVYPSSTFEGNRLFGYALGGTERTDEVLGFALKYLNINNIGDIVFENYLYTNTFLYVRNSVSTELPVSDGFVRQYVDRTSFGDLIGWQTAAAENRSRQVFRFVYNQVPLVLDVPPASNTVYPVAQIFVGTEFVDPTTYSLTSNSTSTTITFNSTISITTGTVIEVQLISDVPSNVAYYQIPLNLENNAVNENSDSFTLGTIRNHYNSIGQNLKTIQGPINGANNSRDLGNILRYGDNIIQNSSPVALTGVFLRKQQYELFNSLRFNSQEYEKFKAILLDMASKGDYVNNTPTQVLDQILTDIASSKNSQSPFYWSDMVPSGETYTEVNYTHTAISTNVFDTNAVYDFTASNYQSVLVYLNGTLLSRGYGYLVGVDSQTVTVIVPMAIGDIITIREYSTTYGSFVPNTPTKMGLYSAFLPGIFEDRTSTGYTKVIQGHDGSITRAFEDYRDAVLLEFETRIFNNLKIVSDIPIESTEVIPGQFRTTDYSLSEINQMLSTDFLSWVGWNKLDYTTQTYLEANEFTWNYSQSGNKLTQEPLLGAWRGINNYFYDTLDPAMHPWEMLGFSQMPKWWQNEYGPAPYTSGNMVLWQDLEDGFVRDPAGYYVLPQYIRPGLTSVIPTGTEGELLSPLSSVVGNYDRNSFRRSWTFGDGGPVESTWRASSAWPFAVMRLLALTKPAKFFSLFADRDRYVYNPIIEQYLWDDRYRLDPKKLNPLYGDGTSKASYMNWIIDYNRQLGNNSTAALSVDLANIGLRLCWRLAAFSDKNYLKIYAERSTPNSLNTSLLLPDESYQILLYKNQPFEQVAYSSVIVQKTDIGYAVLGYSTTQPYFNVLVSRTAGLKTTITVGSASVTVPVQYSDNVVSIPYGYVFTSESAVCDFLLSYGKLLEQQGMTFDTRENGYIIDWNQMTSEFLYWSQQGWAEGSMINLNPTASQLTVTKPGAVADSIATPSPDNIILNQNRQKLPASDLVIDRLDNTFSVTSLSNSTISFINLKFTAYEHLVVFDNVSIFADLIYDPVTGARQSRLLVSGVLSADWNGTVNAPGFVLNQNNIVEWIPNQKYAKGSIVLFKNEYWSASTIIQPSENFNYALWLKSDYNEIKTGLLPNAAFVSDQLASAYSVDSANLEREVDLFSFGLIGFRPREYMQALNLDDVSQVGLYQQFLGDKGTTRSAELFTYADLGKETSEYNIYEYWAILKSQYGATANRRYVEFLLNEPKLKSDPSLIQLIGTQETSQADQAVLIDDLWKSSYNVTSPAFLPTTEVPITDSGLPTAGYPSLDDVDITVFSFDDPQVIDDNLENISVGTTIWVAKTNPYDWGISRCETVPGNILVVSDNLNGRSKVEFSKQHGLSVGDFIIIRYFDSSINGIYSVLSVPSLTTILIGYAFVGDQTSVAGLGVGFTLQTARVVQPADVSLLPYSKSLTPGARVWVDNGGLGKWTVLEKTSPFTAFPSIVPTLQSADQKFGSAIAQGFRNLSALIGAPGYNGGQGGIYNYVKDSNNQYIARGEILTLGAIGTQAFGSAIDVGDQTWAVAGAYASDTYEGYAVVVYRSPSSQVFEESQLLTTPDGDTGQAEFGYSVAISQDERWMYIGAPGINKVYAYGRVEVQPQEIYYTTTAGTNTYNYSDYIEINNTKDQLSVILNNTIQYLQAPGSATGYYLDNGNVVFNFVPGNNLSLLISRSVSVQLDVQQYTEITGTVSPAGGAGAEFTVDVIRGAYSTSISTGGNLYNPNDVITVPGTSIGGASPANDLTITVTQTGSTYTTQVNGGTTVLTVPSTDGLDIGQELFYSSGTGSITPGTTILTIDSPTQITIDTPIPGSSTATYSLIFFPGNSYISNITFVGAGPATQTVFSIEEYLYTATSLSAFSVTVNGELYRPDIDYTYASGNISFITVPGLGASIIVASGTYWQHTATLSPGGLAGTDRFGHSLATTTDGRQVMVGCPATTITQDGVTYLEGGRVYVYDSSAQRFQVTDTAQLEYTTVRTPTDPEVVAVNLNGIFLNNQDQFDNGQFSILGNVVTLTSSVSLTVGDILEIDTNQFELLQVIESSVPRNNSKFGYAVDQCINDCSLYVGSPYNSTMAPQAGLAEFYLNQARVYGTITSGIANPTLTAGEYIRINNYFVESTGTSVAELKQDIINADIPNVTVTLVPDVSLVGNGTTTVFDVGNIYSSADSYTAVVYVDDVLQVSGYSYNNSTEQITFTSAPAFGAVIVVVSGRITFAVKNSESALPRSKLQILPGTGTVFDDLGISLYVNQQVITSPVTQDGANFGKCLTISSTATGLVVGAPNGTTIEPTTFDRNTTTFDALSTTFSDPVTQSGAVYLYDFLPAVNASVSNPGQFVFGQQVFDQSISELDGFGSALNYTTGTLLIGSPNKDISDSTIKDFDDGRVAQFINTNLDPAWSPIRIQQPSVDTALLNTIYMYDRVNGNVKQYFDYFNPLQGKLLGAVRQNIDYIGAVDPAAYNVGDVNNYGSYWAQTRVGQIWWDTNNVRFIDPNQNDIVYASRRWGQVFPGSSVEIYQWVESTVPPISYAGEGTPLNTTSYVVTSSIDEQGLIIANYYFWVTGIRAVDLTAQKTLSIDTLARYIEAPRSSGISYIAPINSSTVAIYNGLEYIIAEDTILHVEFDQIATENEVHVEFQLIAANRPNEFLNAGLYQKLQDSFCGVNLDGKPVPDPFLPPSEQYGVAFRPRQSMFANRFLALNNYLTRANEILSLYPISETRSFTLLNSQEPQPSEYSGAWNKRVANREELTYQDLNEVALGYKYLVVNDSSNDGLWTIYEVIAGPLFGSKELRLIRVQNYDTTRYWSYINWYAVDYNPLTRPVAEVANRSDLDTLTLPAGSVVKVTANARGKFEIYRYTDGTWVRVGLQDGTIKFSASLWDYDINRYGFDNEVFDAQYFDQEPITETRKIIQALNQQLLTGDLEIERNRLLVLMFNYILSEQIAPLWLTKTSLIDVEHTIRQLVEFQNYRQDNQDFVLNYIQEVKPYHVQIREFNLKYTGFDQYNGTTTDFDLPAYWDSAQGIFVSPVLDNTGELSTTSSVPSTSQVWQTLPWNQWYQNYLLSINSITIISGGTGYLDSPTIEVIGDCIEPAVLFARVNSAGKVIIVDIVNPGYGYSTTPVITVTSTSGTGAFIVANMGNDVVRNITTTIKYDRYEYQTSIVYWQANVAYTTGTQVRYRDVVWSANENVQTSTFDPEQWTVVPASDLSGVDRTMGYYAPRANEPGLDLALLISGVDYPGVQVYGLSFDQNTGFDVGNFDVNPYDNFSIGPEGLPTYDPAILDAIYESNFVDPYLGVGPAAIEVNGGAFIDTYESHAPEELVPGAIFDTLDIRVITTPGSDWELDGHGFPVESISYTFTIPGTVYSYQGLVNYPSTIKVFNQTIGTELIPNVHFVVNWVQQRITLNSGISTGDVVTINAYQVGGANQMYINSYIGSELVGNSILAPIEFDLVVQAVLFVNGQFFTNITTSQEGQGYTRIQFGQTMTSTDYIALTILGPFNGFSPSLIPPTWSLPVTQYFVSAGQLSYSLTNSMMGTNAINAVVEKNGIRARPPESALYLADGSSADFYLPVNGGYSQGSIADNDVFVYVSNNQLQLGSQYVVNPWDGINARTVTLSRVPPDGATVIVAVRTGAQYSIIGGVLLWNSVGGFIPLPGDVISVTTWNDTSQQNMLTQVFVGPTSQGVQITQTYDSIPYDQGTVTGSPGSFDYAQGTVIQTNVFNTGQFIADGTRAMVSLDGFYLFENIDYSIQTTAQGSAIVIAGPPISAAQVVAVTSFTSNITPGSIAFRIFQDMRGVQSTYRITASTSTVLAQSLEPGDTTIYVEDASRLSEPNLPNGVFGLITINGERISYRVRNTDNNTLSGLRRGTAGTGAADHPADSPVYDIGRGNLLPAEYQDRLVVENFLGDGFTTVFVAENITVEDMDSTELVEAVLVYVGGTLQTTGYAVTGSGPVSIEFDTAPTAGYQVSIQVRRGLSWYEPGPSTASNGQALQVTNTLAARFIRGE